MPRFALRLEYDGAAYGGSQRQSNAPSVQAALEEAIQRVAGEAVRTAFAGRTDAGVHASGQVVAFTCAGPHAAAVWQRALNALLPPEIAVTASAAVAATFDPRRHALRRVYDYTIWNATVRSPLRRTRAWWVREPLAEAGMVAAARLLEGDHDLASFGGAPGPGRSTRRVLHEVGVRREGAALTVRMVGNAFLPHQVRRTVGALVEIGRGRLPVEQVQRWLDQPRPNAAGPTAPAHGLVLRDVVYEPPLFAVSREGREHDEDVQHQDR